MKRYLFIVLISLTMCWLLIPSYTPKCRQSGCSIKASKAVIDIAKKYFEGEVAHKNESFGNARMVRNYFEEATINQANRLVSKDNITDNMLCRFVEQDMPKRFFVTDNFFKAV